MKFEAARVFPAHQDEYHVRMIRTANIIGKELKLFVPGQVRHDTSLGVVEALPEENVLHLAVGDTVLVEMKEGGYNFEMKDGAEKNVRYLVHPGRLAYVDEGGNNHIMVKVGEILCKVRRDA